MRYHIDSTVRAVLIQLATNAVPHEICGFLLGEILQDHIQIDDFIPVANGSVLADRFVIRESEMLRARHAARERMRKIVGLFHSHPNGPAGLSVTDQKSLRRSPIPWLLVDVPSSRITLHSCDHYK